MDYMWIVWLILAVIFLVLEIMTVALISVWFVLGAIVAMIAALMGANLTVQISLMLVVSIIFLVLSYFVKKKYDIGTKFVPTNSDALIGQLGVVTQTIENLENVGLVKIRGQIWSAESASDSVILEAEMKVIVEEIRGVKLIVSAAKEEG